VVATAQLRDGRYVAHAPQRVGSAGALLDRMHVGERTPTLLGFDFPIGLPRVYAERAGVRNFTDWLSELDAGSQFFDVADRLSEVSLARPFFPRKLTSKAPGIKQQFRAKLGLSAQAALRRCDRAHAARRAASEMFWTLGPQAVGKATLTGWRDTLVPALTECDRRYAIWPFDGQLFELLWRVDAVIVESYPAEDYGHLGLPMGSRGTAKTSQRHRQAVAARLMRWSSASGVDPDEALVREIGDGFGAGSDGEDRFDAVVGLFGMINTILTGREPPLPDDPAIRRVEGWMFGRSAG
jgi:hypothetical protein